jgi:hypothetical protein
VVRYGDIVLIVVDAARSSNQAQLFILAGPIVFARETFDVVILRKIFRKDFCVVERMNWMVEDVASRIL